MKKILLTLACMAGLYGVQAQTFTVPSDTVKATYYGNGVMVVHDNITNITTDTTFEITWNVVACTFPPSWKADTAFGICDISGCQTNVGNQLTNGTAFTTLLPYKPNIPGDFHLQLDLHWPPSANENGVYYTVVNLKNGGYTKQVVFQIGKYATGITNVNNQDDILVCYPNPAKNNLYLNYSGPGAVKTLTIHNLIGKMVRTFTATSNNVQLDIADVPAGVYYLRLNDAQGQVLASRRFTHQ